MRYVSTRGCAPELGFAEATLAGLASDGGLYVPTAYPRLSEAEIAGLAGLSYAETATRVLGPFIGDAVAAAELGPLLAETYATFDVPDVTPLRALGDQHHLLELFHGPTLAFKDVALQLLGRLFARFLGGERLTIVGATSGDTGSAAIAALAHQPTITCVMLHPRGRTSDIQRRQMTTVLSPNIHNLAIEGTFDDCQAIVKQVLGAPPPGRAFSAVNSINWARLAAQVVYYFHAAVRLGAPARRVAFSVPTGNFGDVFAGYVAARMGLPIERLIVATNVNDILHRALSEGDYSRAAVRVTASPSMDIQVSSNFERLLFDLMDRDPARLGEAMAGFEATGRMALPAEARARAAALFTSACVDEAEAAATMRDTYARHGLLIDPHTAVGLAAARRLAPDLPEGTPIVTLATAHPAKFPDAVVAATGARPELPARLAHLLTGEERYTVLPTNEGAVRAYLARMPDPPFDLTASGFCVT